MIKIGNKKVNKIMIGNKEVLKVIIGNNTSSGIVKYIKSSPTPPSANPYKAIIKYYDDSSGQLAVAEIYDNSNNTLIGTTQPLGMLQNPNTGLWRYNFNNIKGPISTTLYIAGILGTMDYSNSTAKLHMVYTKTGWAFSPAYVKVEDSNSNVYYTQTVSNAVTDAVQDINMLSFPNTSQYLNIGGYTNTDYTSGSSNFKLNKVSTTLEFDFDVTQ